MKNLNLGCGSNPKKGWININNENGKGVDAIWDLNSFPYPFKTSSISKIIMDNVLEHLNNPMAVMKEIWRISEDDAIIKINVPHFKMNTMLWYPEHKHEFMPRWFETWDSSTNASESAYTRHSEKPKENFKVMRIRTIKRGQRIFKRMPFLTHMVGYEIEVFMRAIK